jgi:hypothetical protein
VHEASDLRELISNFISALIHDNHGGFVILISKFFALHPECILESLEVIFLGYRKEVFAEQELLLTRDFAALH